MKNGCMASASSPNPMAWETHNLSTEGTKDMDRTYSKQHFESDRTRSLSMDIQFEGFDGSTLNGITLGGSTLGVGTDIRCKSSNKPEMESAPGFQVRSAVYRARHTPAFNVERKLRRRRKAQTKKKDEQIERKEEQLRKARKELKGKQQEENQHVWWLCLDGKGCAEYSFM